VFYQLGEKENAINQLQKAEDDPDAWHLMGVIYEELGDAEKAKECFEIRDKKMSTCISLMSDFNKISHSTLVVAHTSANYVPHCFFKGVPLFFVEFK
jgi:hypothetical protein